MATEDTTNTTKSLTKEGDVDMVDIKDTTRSLLRELSLFWDPVLGVPNVPEKRRFVDRNSGGAFFEVPYVEAVDDKLIFISMDYLRDIPSNLPE